MCAGAHGLLRRAGECGCGVGALHRVTLSERGASRSTGQRAVVCLRVELRTLASMRHQEAARSLHLGTADALGPVRAPTVEQPNSGVQAARFLESEVGHGRSGTWAPVTLLTARFEEPAPARRTERRGRHSLGPAFESCPGANPIPESSSLVVWNQHWRGLRPLLVPWRDRQNM